MSEMADRRRRRGANYRQEGSRTHSRSQNGRPPTGTWQPAVPQWEKKFCNEVGSVPWGRIVETKKVMHYYPNVVEWNDSAVEEAFNREKSRFWAAINGLPCDISLPDSDMYIDEIDWDSDDVDPELLLDLDRECLGSDQGETDGNLGLTADILFLMNQPVPCTGWGTDEEEEPPRTANNTPDQVVPCTGWGDEEDLTRKAYNTMHQPVPCTGWGDEEEDLTKTAYNTLSGPGLEGNGGENNINESEHSRSTRTGGNLGTWNSDRPKGGGAGGYTSRRFRRSSFQSDNNGLTADILFLMNQPVACTGWGTDEEDPPRAANNTPDQVVPCTGWGDEEDLTRMSYNTMHQPVPCTRWGDEEEDLTKTAYNTLSGPGLEGNGGENDINESEHSRSTRTGGNLGTWNSNRLKGGGAGGYTSRRFRKARLQSDNNGQRTGKVWKKMNFVHYHQVMEPNPLVPKQWNSMNTCGPMSYNKSDREGRLRDYEKRVSLR